MYLPTAFSRDSTIIWTTVMLGIQIISVILLQCAIVYNLVYPKRPGKGPDNPLIKPSAARLFSVSVYDNPFIEKKHGL